MMSDFGESSSSAVRQQQFRHLKRFSKMIANKAELEQMPIRHKRQSSVLPKIRQYGLKLPNLLGL